MQMLDAAVPVTGIKIAAPGVFHLNIGTLAYQVAKVAIVGAVGIQSVAAFENGTFAVVNLFPSSG